MQDTSSMEEKLALWKAHKKSKVGIKSSQTQPLRVKTNAPRVKTLDNPKILLKKQDSIKKTEDNITRLLPDNIIQSALSIVSNIETPGNQTRIKPLPSPHLLTMEKLYKSTQTMQTDSDLKLKYDELMDLYQGKIQEIKDLSRELHVAREENEKDLEIIKVIESNEELQDKLLSLKAKYDKIEKQGNEWHAELLQVQESFLQELQDKSQLKQQIQELLQEKVDMENDLKEFQELLTDMKMVAMESENKDEDIMKLEIKVEEFQEQILALEAQIFKSDQDFSEFQHDFVTLKEKYNQCLLQMETYHKETCHGETQTKQVYMESIFTQTSQMNQNDELTRHNAMLRMNNSILTQKLQESEKIHQMKITELTQQMDTENQKWQEIEMSQATMHRKLIDALEKTVAKNKELKKELEKKN